MQRTGTIFDKPVNFRGEARLPAGGRRPGAGRPRMPDIRSELAGIRTELARLRQQRRDELEAGPAILSRLSSIERALGLLEVPRMPRPNRRRPLDA
jgi:hypothetical protein